MTNGKADCNDNVFTTLEEKPEEYTDIEWLEASVDEEEKDTQELVTCNVIECSREPTAASVTKTSPYTREDRLQAIRIHKTHLLILLSCLIKLNVLASDPLVIGCCLSVIPGDCVLSEEDIQGPVEEWKEKCRRLVLFCCHFVGKQRTCDWKSRENYMFWQPLDILQWLQSPRPVACIFAVFVCAIFRGLGMRCRLVQSLIPFSKQPCWTSNTLLGRRSNQSSSNSSVLSPSNLADSDSCWFAPWTMEWSK